MRRIIFSHRRAVGDALMFTCGVRDFKLLFPEIEIDVDTNFMEVFYNNPYITRSEGLKLNRSSKEVEFYKVGYPVINNANAAATHFTQAFLFDMIAMADLHEPLPIKLYELMSSFSNGVIGDPDIATDKTNQYREKSKGGLKNLPVVLRDKYADNDAFCHHFGRIRPDIHLGDAEKKTNLVRKVFGVEHYWVVAPGGKRDCTCKIWDWRRFQKVIDYFEGRIKFVAIGRSDHLVEKLRGIIDLTDKFNNNLRGLFPLVYHADGCISGISLLHHLCAAMPNKKNPRIYGKPNITIYGGREPITFTIYNQTYPLHTGGALHCCEYGGCWHSRVFSLPKDQHLNKRLCRMPVEVDNRTIQKCMDMIEADDIIRQLEIIYSGNIYNSLSPVTKPIKREVNKKIVKKFSRPEIKQVQVKEEHREINFLASMNTDGGGEQSAAKIVSLLRSHGWKVNFYPWNDVHKRFKGIDFEEPFLKTRKIKSGLPLFFYANDNINDLLNIGKEVIKSSSFFVPCINFINGRLPVASEYSDKLKAVIFQNEEKMLEFKRDQLGVSPELIVLFGAIEIDRFIEVCTPERRSNDPLVVLKHCKPDYRKYVTSMSVDKGDRPHIWQKTFAKDLDVVFYKRLLKDTKNIFFYFMQAHPELEEAFKDEERMKFFKWDEISVTEFLSLGHVYLYRTSNRWRDQYPRVVAEALAAGLPVLTEPRDGTKDRVIHGDTGFYCIDFDSFKLALKTLQRKENARRQMGMFAKDWANINLNPIRWVELIETIVGEYTNED